MAGGKGNIKPEDGKQFSSEYQPQQKWTEERALSLANELIDWLKAKDEHGEDKGNIFFQEFLIIEKDLYEELISYLCKKFTSFLKLINKAEKIQELKLQKYGVGDRLNATMTKFVLINKHDWKDRTESTLKGDKDSPLTIISLGSGTRPNETAD
jgi:hypothetical protein